MRQRAPSAEPAPAPEARLDCLELIRQHLPNLKGTARTIGTHLLTRPWESRGLTVSDLAATIGVSENAIVRFSQALGYSGYRELSNELALSLGQAVQRAFSIPSEALLTVETDQTSPTIVRRMFDLQGQCLQETAHHLSDVLIERAVVALCQARRVVFGAMGGTAPIAQLGAFRLLMYGIDAFWTSDPYMTMASAGILQAGDVAFGISHSGQSRLAVEFLQFARERGATTIALTAVPGSPLTTVADVVLAVFGPDVELSQDLQRFGSRISGMALIEALVAAVAVRKFGANPPQIAVTRAKIQQTLEPSTVHPHQRRRPASSPLSVDGPG
ncbi:MAG: MurR/RpiR family transcriptional regulator [Chloroflexi bacterium]|nr:MurR/RpiR family transcriptional regulator [Chloroflexota bacterium]